MHYLGPYAIGFVRFKVVKVRAHDRRPDINQIYKKYGETL